MATMLIGDSNSSIFRVMVRAESLSVDVTSLPFGYLGLKVLPFDVSVLSAGFSVISFWSSQI
jgi:hypothetical protein